MRVVRQQLLDAGGGAEDVLGVARQCRPAEWTDAAAEQRADIGRHEAWEVEGIGDAGLLRHLPDVVAVVEGGHAAPPELEHRAYMHGHRFLGRALYAFVLAGAARFPFMN